MRDRDGQQDRPDGAIPSWAVTTSLTASPHTPRQVIVIGEARPEDAAAIRAFLVRSFGDEVAVAHGRRIEPARLAAYRGPCASTSVAASD